MPMPVTPEQRAQAIEYLKSILGKQHILAPTFNPLPEGFGNIQDDGSDPLMSLAIQLAKEQYPEATRRVRNFTVHPEMEPGEGSADGRSVQLGPTAPYGPPYSAKFPTPDKRPANVGDALDVIRHEMSHRLGAADKPLPEDNLVDAYAVSDASHTLHQDIQLPSEGKKKMPDNLRPDGTLKGVGFLGPRKRTDGRTSSEISIGVNIDGKEMDIPTMVPTLDDNEVNWLLSNDISDPKKIPQSIVDKATDFARMRLATGKPVFAETPKGFSEATPQQRESVVPQGWPDWLKRVLTADDPTAEPIAAKNTTEPDTWWGGFKKGLYNEFVRPLTSAQGVAGLITGGEEPAQLSKVEMGNLASRYPNLVQKLLEQKGEMSLRPFHELLKMVKGEPEFTSPVLKRIEAAIKAGEGQGGWDPLTKFGEAFGDDKDAMKVFARLWGANSPNTPVARTNYETLVAQKAALEGTTPMSVHQARGLDITMPASKVPNINRAVAGLPLQSSRGEVGKTENMAQLLLGDKKAIPVDVQALSGVGAEEPDVSRIYPGLRAYLEEKGMKGSGKAGKFTYQDLYDITKSIYNKGLAKFGEDMFPTMWEGVKVLKGQGKSPGATEWFKKWGLLEPDQMKNPEALEHVIQNVDRSEFYGQPARMKQSVNVPEMYIPPAQQIQELTTQNQGATFHPGQGNLSGQPYFSVATYPERTKVFKGAPSQRNIQEFMSANKDLLDPKGENSIGTWWDKDAKEYVLDIVKTVPDKQTALKLGQEHGQKAIFDLGKLEEIPVPTKPEDMLAVSHRTTQKGLTTLDPEYHGTGMVGEEGKRMTDPDYLKRIYFTIKGQPVEGRFRNMPHTYDAELPRKSVYFIEDDPQGLVHKARELGGGDPARTRTLFELLAHKAGYKGVSDGTAVAWFEPVGLNP